MKNKYFVHGLVWIHITHLICIFSYFQLRNCRRSMETWSGFIWGTCPPSGCTTQSKERSCSQPISWCLSLLDAYHRLMLIIAWCLSLVDAYNSKQWSFCSKKDQFTFEQMIKIVLYFIIISHILILTLTNFVDFVGIRKHEDFFVRI